MNTSKRNFHIAHSWYTTPAEQHPRHDLDLIVITRSKCFIGNIDIDHCTEVLTSESIKLAPFHRANATTLHHRVLKTNPVQQLEVDTTSS